MHITDGNIRAALAASVWALFGHTACAAAAADAPAVYAVDSSNALLAYDAAGKRLARMQFRAELGRLNGGIALALGNVYVTWDKPPSENPPEPGKSGVYAYDQLTLRPVRLHIGAFRPEDTETDSGAMHGIAYDSGNERFYVATERLGILEFNNAGVPLPRAAESRQSITSVAYDPGRHIRWSIVDHHAVDRFDEAASNSLPGLPAMASRLGHGNGALALAVCTGDTSGVVAVTFGSPKGGTSGSLRIFDAEGKSIEPPRKIARPNAMSCSTSGELLVAADQGLMKYGLRSSTLPSSVEWAGLIPPVYGAMAAY